MDRQMEAKNQESSHCIAIESSKTDDHRCACDGHNGHEEPIDDIGDNQLMKVLVISIKVMLIGMSAVYLCYEGIQLIRLYNSYETIVSVHYQISDIKDIPSLTICLPTIIDKNKLFEEYPDLSQKLNQSLTEDKRSSILTDALDKTLESDAWTRLTIQEEQALNCTLNYWSIKPDWHSISSDKRNAEQCREVVKPIESYSNAKTKCFTYFSQLSGEQTFLGEYSLRDGLNNLNDLYEIIRIELELDFDRYLSLPFVQNETTIAIHHQNMIGENTGDTLRLEAGHQYDITVNKITTNLMPEPYESQCYDYNKKKDGFASRKQCIDYCVLDLYKDKCDCIPIHLSDTLQLLDPSHHVICTHKDLTFRSKSCYDDIAQEVGLCLTSERCPQECQTIEYRHRLQSRRLMSSCEEMSRPNATDICSKKVLIRVRMDWSAADQVVDHVPLITAGQFLAHISALIAIFSGVSIISLSNSLIARLSAIQRKQRSRVRDGSDKDGCDQQIKQRAKQWLTEKSRCIDQSETTVDSIECPKPERQTRAGIRRPATSSLSSSHAKTVHDIDVKSYDI